MSGHVERRVHDAGAGLTLHVESRGAGPAVLLLHGFTGSSRTWDALAAVYASRFRTIAVDLPGHGGSSAPRDPDRYALGRLAGDLAATLDALQVERVAVIGYSLGGRAALRFALDQPHRVEALVLESASAGLCDESEREARVRADRALAERLERHGIAAFVDEWERLPLWASQSALDLDVRAALRAQRLRNDPVGLANSLRGAGAGLEPCLEPRLSELRVPTLLIVGALDAKYRGIATRMAERIPGAALAVVPDAGHAAHFERPAAFAAAVASFLENHLTSARALPTPPPGAPAR